MQDTTPPPPLPQADARHQTASKILEDLGLTEIPADQKNKLLARIALLVDQEIMYAILSRLTEDDVRDLESYLQEQGQDNPINEQTYEFLQTRIPNLQQVIEQAMVAVYDRLKTTNDILAS